MADGFITGSRYYEDPKKEFVQVGVTTATRHVLNSDLFPTRRSQAALTSRSLISTLLTVVGRWMSASRMARSVRLAVMRLVLSRCTSSLVPLLPQTHRSTGRGYLIMDTMNSHKFFFAHFRVEPQQGRFCMRCCKSKDDQVNCNSHGDRDGCRKIMSHGTYTFGPNVSC